MKLSSVILGFVTALLAFTAGVIRLIGDVDVWDWILGVGWLVIGVAWLWSAFLQLKIYKTLKNEKEMGDTNG